MGFPVNNTEGSKSHGGGRPLREVALALHRLTPLAIKRLEEFLNDTNKKYRLEAVKEILKRVAPELHEDVTGWQKDLNEKIENFLAQVIGSEQAESESKRDTSTSVVQR